MSLGWSINCSLIETIRLSPPPTVSLLNLFSLSVLNLIKNPPPPPNPVQAQFRDKCEFKLNISELLLERLRIVKQILYGLPQCSWSLRGEKGLTPSDLYTRTLWGQKNKKIICEVKWRAGNETRAKYRSPILPKKKRKVPCRNMSFGGRRKRRMCVWGYLRSKDEF